MQIALYRAMSPSRRCELAVQMSEDARQIALAGIRARHPEYDATTARFALFRILVGDDLFRRAWPDAPLIDP
ncbi:MAG: hypothetical protein H0V17_20250 [Deltaproteobacteria bacterium]|nr:hypothetical protein [Deltaproteobacteria bacterium]